MEKGVVCCAAFFIVLHIVAAKATGSNSISRWSSSSTPEGVPFVVMAQLKPAATADEGVIRREALYGTDLSIVGFRYEK